MLFHPDWNAQFELHVDASKLGCGAMLAQEKDGVLCPVRFASRAFSSAESRWTTMHQELFAVKWELEQFRSYLIGRRVKVVTGHANLKWLTTIAPQQAKVARWCMSMAEFDFFIEHRKGERNVVPDVLSCHPVKENIPEDNIRVVHNFSSSWQKFLSSRIVIIERRRRSFLGGSGGMLPQEILTF